MSIELFEQAAEATPGTSLEDFETWLGLLLESQRDVLWQIGDLALAVERQHPKTFHQAFPEWISPGLIDRCKAVSAAYPPQDRHILGTWTVHMQNSKYPDRVARVLASVKAGQTSDENRKNPAPVQVEEPAVVETVQEESPAVTQEESAPAEPEKPRWLLCVDVNYYIHRYFHSGAGVESAKTFDEWLARTIGRLVDKGLTDVVCCLDSHTNHRKTLTEGWEQGYKPRAEKDAELAGQLRLAPDLLKARNLPVISMDDMEADDVMASYAKQFAGRVTLLTQDKDMRQCLSQTCNILQDVTWQEHPETGQNMPVYKWVSMKQHIEEGSTYSGTKVVGITPELWPHFQAIAGDSTDGIRGCEGIGGKGAMDLILAHGTVQNVIAACKLNTANLTAKKINAVLDFEPLAETMLLLTTLRTDLQVPKITALCMKEST